MPRKRKGELPSGSVRYRLFVGADAAGKKKYLSFTAPTMKQAKEKAEEWKRSHRSVNAVNPSFSEAAASFLENRSSTLSPSTFADYKRRIERIEFLYPDFARSHMNIITSETVQILINDLSSRMKDHHVLAAQGKTGNKKISPKTVSNYYALICAVLKTQGVVISDVRLPQSKKAPLVIPENSVVQELLKEIKGTELEIPVLLAAFGPMRRGEICALRMEDIDFGSNTVHVHRNMVLNSDQVWVIKQPKSAAGDRYIKYPDYVIRLIAEKKHIVKCNPDSLSRLFTRTLSRHGFEHFRFHDLRHFSASFQIALGIPPEYVMERGGWNTGYTMARYVHALDEQKKKMSEKANSAFEDLL